MQKKGERVGREGGATLLSALQLLFAANKQKKSTKEKMSEATTETTTTPTPGAEGVRYDPEGKQKQLQERLGQLFSSLGEYMTAELGATADDFRMLQELNEAAAQKYAGMANSATKLAEFMENLQANCACGTSHPRSRPPPVVSV